MKAYRELIALTKQGMFRLPRGNHDGGDDDGEGSGTASGGGSSSNKRKRQQTTKSISKRKPRRVKTNEAALVGETFEDDGIDWKVLDVAWSDEFGEVLVWYYDLRSVEAEGVLEEDLFESFEEGLDCHVEHVEYSRVSEVRAWLKKASASAQGRG